jgi:hypothetical protein
MLKQVILGVVTATFVGSAAASEWAFDDAYWQQALSEPSRISGAQDVTLSGREGFGAFEPLPQLTIGVPAKNTVVFAAADSVVQDVPASDESTHDSGVAIVESQNAEHQALERSGFTQFAD